MLKHLSLTLNAVTLLLLVVATLCVQGQSPDSSSQLPALRSSQIVFSGVTVRLRCVSDSPEGIRAATRPFNPWTKDGEAIDLDGRISESVFSLSSTLTIRNAQFPDEGVYVCSRPGFRNLTTTLFVNTGVLPGRR